MKTVFFGPFIGEFGWEVLYWSAWINRLIDEKYKNCHIIVASQGGRELFYPKANEFWPLPDWFCDAQYVQNGYISDGWENGLPRGNFSRIEKLFGIIERERWGYVQSEEGCRNFKEVALKLLNHFKEKLPCGAEIICPFQDNKINEIEFGVRKANSLKQDPIQKRVPFDEQIFFKFTPNKTKLTREFVKQLKQKRVIAIFPRYRETRRPDKNWSKEKYEDLIKMLKMQFPTHKLAIFGAPNGAYFSEGCPEDVMDLINIDPKERTNIQAAILERADFAVGSLSGAMVFARFCGVPVMTWSLERDKDRFHDENRLDIPTYFISNRDPSVIQVFQIIKDHFDNKTGLRTPFKEWSSEAYLSTGNGYAQKRLDSFRKILRLIFYAKN